jgi:hypothetical protein
MKNIEILKMKLRVLQTLWDECFDNKYISEVYYIYSNNTMIRVTFSTLNRLSFSEYHDWEDICCYDSNRLTEDGKIHISCMWDEWVNTNEFIKVKLQYDKVIPELVNELSICDNLNLRNISHDLYYLGTGSTEPHSLMIYHK